MEIFTAKGAPLVHVSVVDTGGKWKKSSIRKVQLFYLATGNVPVTCDVTVT
jgi:hypothetical protein